jgi:hypothetical protein
VVRQRQIRSNVATAGTRFDINVESVLQNPGGLAASVACEAVRRSPAPVITATRKVGLIRARGRLKVRVMAPQ